MEYQLVLQWQLDEVDYDQLIEIEDLLIEKLPTEEVDGHDIGRGEANIFVLTNDATRAWETAKLILDEKKIGNSVRAAYRQRTDDEFVILWPKDLSHFKVI